MKPESTQTTIEAAAWRQYPLIDAVVLAAQPALIEALEKTRGTLLRMAVSGRQQERERARTVRAAYDHALSLYAELLALHKQQPEPPQR